MQGGSHTHTRAGRPSPLRLRYRLPHTQKRSDGARVVLWCVLPAGELRSTVTQYMRDALGWDVATHACAINCDFATRLSLSPDAVPTLQVLRDFFSLHAAAGVVVSYEPSSHHHAAPSESSFSTVPALAAGAPTCLAYLTCHLPLATCHLPLATCHLPLSHHSAHYLRFSTTSARRASPLCGAARHPSARTLRRRLASQPSQRQTGRQTRRQTRRQPGRQTTRQPRPHFLLS